jgi:alkylresorcinol/alkylpyrone synthase
MFVTALGTAAPPGRYTQLECWGAIQASPQFSGMALRSRAILKKVLTGKNGINTRHLALDPLDQAFDISPDTLHARFLKNARELAAKAGRQALAGARVEPAQIDAVLVSTCTGYLCPGLTSYVIEELGLRPDVLALDLVGQGCGAAMPNLRTADGLLSSGKCSRALSICVEVCSAAFYLDNDPGVLISACLFGDGAVAAVLSDRHDPAARRVEWKTSNSLLVAEHRDFLRFETKGGMLRNILDPCVPVLAGRHARTVFDTMCAKNGVTASEIKAWIFHGGGRDVLNALREAFELNAAGVKYSAETLAEYGNVSSPFVLFALKAALEDNAPGGLWWMTSFGAGFSCSGALLEVA